MITIMKKDCPLQKNVVPLVLEATLSIDPNKTFVEVKPGVTSPAAYHPDKTAYPL